MRIYHPHVDYTLSGTVVPLSGGIKGIGQTVKQMRAYVTQGRVNPEIVQSARNIVFNCQAKDTRSEIDTLFDYVKTRIRYVNDVLDTETLSPAWYTLQTRSGDCDDKSVLLAALLEAIGIPTRFIVSGYDGTGECTHVHVAAFMPDGEMIELDTTEEVPSGWAAPNPTTLYFEKLPTDPKSILESLREMIFG